MPSVRHWSDTDGPVAVDDEPGQPVGLAPEQAKGGIARRAVPR